MSTPPEPPDLPEAPELRCLGLRERLRLAREERGWSQKELCRRAGLSPEAVRMIETGMANTVRLTTVEQLATALGVSPVWLACWDQWPAPQPHPFLTHAISRPPRAR